MYRIENREPTLVAKMNLVKYLTLVPQVVTQMQGLVEVAGQTRLGAKLHRIPGWESRCRPDPPVVFLLIALNC